MTRAEFLRTIAAAVPGALLSRRVLAEAEDGVRRSRVAALIEAYDAQGIHRTATPVDNSSAEWLQRLAADTGANAQLVRFPIRRIDIRQAYVEGTGDRIHGLPFFDGGFTEDSGIIGALGLPESSAEIALVTIDAAGISSEGQSIADLRRSPAHRAIVAVTNGASPGLSPSNAVSFAKPFGVPVLQVSSEHQQWLSAAAAAHQRVTFVASSSREAVQGLNVVATVNGARPDLAPLVVMTPRSGWWQCASERGGGLACWTEIMRAVAAAKPARRAIFVASSGHELGHFGLDAFTTADPSLIRGAAAWIHLGANIGAAGGAARLQASDDEIEAMASRSLDAAGASVRQRLPRGTVPGGEARNIHVGGGRYVSLLGNGPRFHNPIDRWPDAVDVDAVTRFAAALSELAVTLTVT